MISSAWIAGVIITYMIGYSVARSHVNLTLFLVMILIGVVIRFSAFETGVIFRGYFIDEVRGTYSDLLWSFIWLSIFTVVTFISYVTSGNHCMKVARRVSGACKIPLHSDKTIAALFYGATALGVSFLLISVRFGGIENAIVFLSRRALAGITGLGFLNLSLQFSFVFIGIAIYFARLNKRSFLSLLAVTLATIVIWLSFVTGSRGTTAIYSLGFCLFWYWTPIKPSGNGSNQFGISLRTAILLISIIVLGVFAIVVVGADIRNVAQGKLQMFNLLTSFDGAILKFLAAFPIIDLMSSVKIYVEYHGHDYGLQFVNYFGRFIPRALWPEKPEIFGVAMRFFFSGDRLSGVPPTMPGEWYIAFGHIGIVVSGIILGFALRVCDKLWLLARQQRDAIIPAVFLTGIVPIRMVREGMEIGLFFIIYTAVAFFLFKIVSVSKFRA